MREKWCAQNPLNFTGSEIISLIFVPKKKKFANAITDKLSSASGVNCMCIDNAAQNCHF